MQQFNFNWKLFATIVLAWGLLTAFSFIAASALHDGTLGNSAIGHFFAKLFYAFRFPMHTLLWSMVSRGGFILYGGGLLINILLYSFIIERLFYFIPWKTRNLA